MLIYNDTFAWDGFGGKLKLASGECWLRIIDRRKASAEGEGVTFVRPYIIIVSDKSGKKMSVKSCAGHIATLVTEKFNIAPNRMYYIEYYDKIEYGQNPRKTIPEKFESVEFDWHDSKAINPRWRSVNQSIIDMIKSALKATPPLPVSDY
ncbi:MAG: hypothetical protein KJ737_01335 [Proteobacteria bacterium]|nr:hypothetical protein [Pseudomonadota bacterium]